MSRIGFSFDMMLPLIAETHRITSQSPKNEGGLFTQGVVGLPTGTRLWRTRTLTLPGFVQFVSFVRRRTEFGAGVSSGTMLVSKNKRREVGSNPLIQQWPFDSLLGAIWLQFMWLVTTNQQPQLCPYCGDEFSTKKQR
jgi:hypothetical protein